jgi:hypothetical protein
VNKDLHTKIEGAGSLKGGAVAENAKNDPICKQALDICMLPWAVSPPRYLLLVKRFTTCPLLILAKPGGIVCLETKASISIKGLIT